MSRPPTALPSPTLLYIPPPPPPPPVLGILILPQSIHTITPTMTWPCGLRPPPARSQPFLAHPRPSQLIHHCWHISNWAGIDKGLWTGPRGLDTAEKLRANTLCDHIRPVRLRGLPFPYFSLSRPICLNHDSTLVWAAVEINTFLQWWYSSETSYLQWGR